MNLICISRIIYLLVVSLTLGLASAHAADTRGKTDNIVESNSENNSNLIDLRDFLTGYFKKHNVKSIIDPRVRGHILVTGVKFDTIDYSMVLKILYTHGYAAIKYEDVVLIILASKAKQNALPVISENDKRLSYEYVTGVIKVKYADVLYLMPILRPLMSNSGHLAAHRPSNRIFVTDTYSNFKKIQKLIQVVDIKGQKPVTRNSENKNK